MLPLGRAADAQTPALRDLNARAGQLTTLLRRARPVRRRLAPVVPRLGEASGRRPQAAKAATPTVAELRRFARDTPELGKNLAIVLEDLYDRKRAVEKDPRSPGGQG